MPGPTQGATAEDDLNLQYKQERLKAIRGKEFSPELQVEVDQAVKAITTKGSKANPTELYMLLASKYPKHSAALKRIFLPKSATIEQTILGDADTFMGAQ